MPFLQIDGNYIEVAETLHLEPLISKIDSTKLIDEYKKTSLADVGLESSTQRSRTCFFNTSSTIAEQQQRLLNTTHLFDSENVLKDKDKTVSYAQGDFVAESLIGCFIKLQDQYFENRMNQELKIISLSYINQDDALCGFCAIPTTFNGVTTYSYCVIENVNHHLEDRKVSIFFDTDALEEERKNTIKNKAKLLSDNDLIDAISKKINHKKLKTVMNFKVLNKRNEEAKNHFQSVQSRFKPGKNYVGITIIPGFLPTFSLLQKPSQGFKNKLAPISEDEIFDSELSTSLCQTYQKPLTSIATGMIAAGACMFALLAFATGLGAASIAISLTLGILAGALVYALVPEPKHTAPPQP